MTRRRAGLRGTTIVELMVGLAIGGIVLAGCASVWAAQLREERRQLAEARLTQDMRAALEHLARDLRRAGARGDPARPASGASAASGVPTPPAGPSSPSTGPSLPTTGPVAPNPYAAVSPASGPADTAAYAYSLDTNENGTVDARERFGLRLRAGTVEASLGSGDWQALTDPAVTTVTRLEVLPSVRGMSLGASCPRACTALDPACPTQQVRSFDIALDARLASDPGPMRSVHARVLLRNHAWTGACPA